jgi:hypothetical protein
MNDGMRDSKEELDITEFISEANNVRMFLLTMIETFLRLME